MSTQIGAGTRRSPGGRWRWSWWGCYSSHDWPLVGPRRASLAQAHLRPKEGRPMPKKGKRAVQPEDVYLLRTVSDPQLSPDGRRVGYVVSWSDKDSDEG